MMPVLCGYIVYGHDGKRCTGAVMVHVETLDKLAAAFAKAMRAKPPGRFYSLELPDCFKMTWYLVGYEAEPALH